MNNEENSVWICWENHRRSRELAKYTGAKFCLFTLDAPRWLRYPYLLFKTGFFILKTKPSIVFCQNPSIVLTFFLALIKKIMGYRLVVDRHSNFKVEYSDSKKLKWRVFHCLSKYTIKYSDFTIVTNDHLKELVEKMGGDAFVLQDKIPDMPLAFERHPPAFMNYEFPSFHAMVVSTFSSDEPISEILEAALSLPSDFRLYFTGNYQKRFTENERNRLKESQVILTGFISEGDYQALMYYSDVVIILTLKDDILNCGSYEAVALEKPMILSDTKLIKSYFRKGCLYTDSNPDNIFNNIIFSKKNNEKLKCDLVNFKPYLIEAWSEKFNNLQKKINSS